MRTIGVVVESKLGPFCILRDDAVGNAILEKHPESLIGEVRNAVKAMPRFGKALVVGAHIGTIAVPLSTHCSELVAVEPNPRAFELLQINAGLQGRENMLLVNCAANDTFAPLEFIVRHENSGGSGRYPAIVDDETFAGTTEQITVQGVRLDDALAEHTFDLVFMDCEGSENAAFRGMPRILADAGTLIVEFIGRHVTNVAGLTVEQWLEPLMPHFDRLFIPTTGKWAEKTAFGAVLQAMIDEKRDDSGIIFQKRSRVPRQ